MSEVCLACGFDVTDSRHGLTTDCDDYPTEKRPDLTIHQWRYIQAEIGAIASDCPEDQMAQSIRDELFRTIGVR